uniref:Secreted protein n=1 Tax=Picea glauca TaxID=3330 RepID=A0A101M2E3_PICGL|nr:hypothetical protein ABT39_MTgene2893 [Picea glauca]QHR87573.1 hypothetical protein Q903MT_gene1584 [Picea sitchensis]
MSHMMGVAGVLGAALLCTQTNGSLLWERKFESTLYPAPPRRNNMLNFLIPYLSRMVDRPSTVRHWLRY